MTDGTLNWFARTGIALATRLNPITGGPASPMKADALLDSFAPSLMPRKSLHQGIAGGLAIISAHAIGTGIDALVVKAAPADSPLAWRIGARAAVVAGGAVIGNISESDDEPTSRASLRSAGRLTALAAAGGIVYEIGRDLESKVKWPLLPLVTGLAGFGLVAVRLGKELEMREGMIQRWTEDDKPASLPGSLGIALGVGMMGRMMGHGFLTSRESLGNYLGGGRGGGPKTVGRIINMGLWSAGAAAAYGAVVARLSRANGKVETSFSVPPSNVYVSGGPNSISPFEELGLQGRRFVSEVVPPDDIDRTLGETGAKHPVRVYIGVQSEPVYATGRSELALQEMDRLGAFDRKYLLLVSPTGTGWVDHTVAEAAEFLARGDIATVCIQYGKAPSFLEIQGVSLGRAQFRQLLWGVRQRLIAVPPENRPKVVVFGESLGAWSSSDVLMHQGIAGFDHYGIENALWFGLPGLARWSRTGMREGRNPLTPEGTVAAFDHFDQYLALPEQERHSLRAVVVDHDNDPISQMSLRLAVKRPPWLDGAPRRNVPPGMRWQPIITFIQIMADAMNAMVTIPGEYKSFGHDYRADTLDFVAAAYDLPPVTPAQSAAIHNRLIERELDRANRIKGPTEEIVLTSEGAGSIQ
ncbi:MAG TPA: alpha/beta-hydrolase family protein [Acidimicrobiia bacterium]|nr:alpha/beta-hydrolase family protein [Acidimicrobiia bacterium]